MQRWSQDSIQMQTRDAQSLTVSIFTFKMEAFGRTSYQKCSYFKWLAHCFPYCDTYNTDYNKNHTGRILLVLTANQKTRVCKIHTLIKQPHCKQTQRRSCVHVQKWCLRSIRITIGEGSRYDSTRSLWLVRLLLKYRVSDDDKRRKYNTWQFRDHQHYEAAVSLNQSNHQVQILFVRACINMYLGLWKAVPGKQPWPPSKRREKKDPGRSKPTNILCSWLCSDTAIFIYVCLNTALAFR